MLIRGAEAVTRRGAGHCHCVLRAVTPRWEGSRRRQGLGSHRASTTAGQGAAGGDAPCTLLPTSMTPEHHRVRSFVRSCLPTSISLFGHSSIDFPLCTRSLLCLGPLLISSAPLPMPGRCIAVIDVNWMRSAAGAGWRLPGGAAAGGTRRCAAMPALTSTGCCSRSVQHQLMHGQDWGCQPHQMTREREKKYFF